MFLSILTMTEYDPTIWTTASFPAEVDQSDLIDKICMDCAEFELLYSEPDILKYMIGNWCRTEQHVWQKLADTLNLQYNPIYNLDVTYDETRTPDITRQRTPNIHETSSGTSNSTRSQNLTEERTPNLTDKRTPNLTKTNTPTDTTTEAVAGFNVSTPEVSNLITRGGTIKDEETGTDTNTHTGTETTKHTGSETIRDIDSGSKSTTGTDTEKTTGSENTFVRRYGNQGVTMTQDMIDRERETVKFNLYAYIVKSFKNRFCLMLY